MNRRCRAFTLVEVVLAILIISAIITVLLYFYQRAVEVRQTVLDEAEYLSVSRMVLEQLTGELRTARTVEDQFVGFEGTTNAISFVCTSLPQSSRWIMSSNESFALPPLTDLRRVTYRLMLGTNALDVRGVDRVEEMLSSGAFTSSTNAPDFASTNMLSESDSNLAATNEVGTIRQPLTARIKHLQFRYWAGTNWVESWSGLELPGGVEITLGRDVVSDTSVQSSPSSEEESVEIFRRVVFLPNSMPPGNKLQRAEPVESF